MLRSPVIALASAVAVSVGFANSPPESDSGITHGTVVITSATVPGASQQWIAVAVDAGAGIAEKVYVLQTSSDVRLPESMLHGASVAYDGQEVRVFDEAGSLALRLAVQAVTRTPDPLTDRASVLGFGLSLRRSPNLEMTGPAVSGYLRLSMPTTCRVSLVDCPECPPPDCQAGGRGSLECSIGGCSGSPSSCSVTCNGGNWYSCCNCNPSASCVCEQA
jgi:hypothetical protein